MVILCAFESCGTGKWMVFLAMDDFGGVRQRQISGGRCREGIWGRSSLGDDAAIHTGFCMVVYTDGVFVWLFQECLLGIILGSHQKIQLHSESLEGQNTIMVVAASRLTMAFKDSCLPPDRAIPRDRRPP